MKLLEERIMKDGEIRPGGIVKVDSFLNHQMDIALIDEMGKEFYGHFKDKNIDRILTVEASGIGIACIAARYFGVPVVFAKKSQSKNIEDEKLLYTAKVHSYTKGNDNIIRVDKKYIGNGENVLIIDDFLANGEAVFGMKSLVEQAGANVAGIGICIEKGFQPGGKMIREAGLDLLSLAIIDIDADGKIKFIEK